MARKHCFPLVCAPRKHSGKQCLLVYGGLYATIESRSTLFLRLADGETFVGETELFLKKVKKFFCLKRYYFVILKTQKRCYFVIFLPSHVLGFLLNVANSLSSSHLQQPAEQAFLNNACHTGSYLHQRA